MRGNATSKKCNRICIAIAIATHTTHLYWSWITWKWAKQSRFEWVYFYLLHLPIARDIRAFRNFWKEYKISIVRHFDFNIDSQRLWISGGLVSFLRPVSIFGRNVSFQPVSSWLILLGQYSPQLFAPNIIRAVQFVVRFLSHSKCFHYFLLLLLLLALSALLLLDSYCMRLVHTHTMMRTNFPCQT